MKQMRRGSMKRSLLIIVGVSMFLLFFNKSLPSQGYFKRQWRDIKELPGNLFKGYVSHFDIEQTESEIERRREHVHNVCTNLSTAHYWSKLKPTGSVWTLKGVNYCLTPKSGCTYWKRGFRYMAGGFSKYGQTKLTAAYTNQQRTLRKPSDIDRMTVHYGVIKGILVNKVKNANLSLLSTGKSFMFSRNPYERIWSAYIDKFLLPDYWMTSAVNIARFSRPVGGNEERDCVNDISFEELVTSIAFGPLHLMNEHWEPVHRICSPCHVSFDIIGKAETFNADSKYITNKYGWQEIDEDQSEDDRIQHEIDILIKYNLDLYEYWYQFHDCYSLLDVGNRLWISFQLNGYIHRDIRFPELKLLRNGFHGNPVKIMSAVVASIRTRQSKKMREELKEQKRSLMLKAYRNLPRKLIEALKGIYKFDFLLFEYNNTLNLE